VGKSLLREWPVTTAIGKLSISLSRISSVDSLKDDQWRITFSNGDRLTGVSELKQIPLETSFGEQKVSLNLIKRARISSASGAHRGMRFDLSNRIEIPNDPRLQFGQGDFAISFWFDTTSPRPCLSFISKRRSPMGDGWVVHLDHDQLLFYCMGCVNQRSEPLRVRDGLWHHVVVTRAAGQLMLYLDNQPVGSGPDLCNHNDLNPIRIGMDGDGEAWHFEGELAQAHFYKRALSAAEVAEEWNEGRGLDQAVDAGGMAAGYHLDTVRGTEASDFTGHGHDGRLVTHHGEVEMQWPPNGKARTTEL
jgi:hypothetical protein